ncbi:nucleotidyltransferase domain-containing protein [Actinosynnema sp. CS-041913]|uniref:nucleotidyltransferase domain-containing protein n=1 Tax=Actinosynnema sp. CS-041913 TaxID=3239917 RepID=UPI003D906277
MRLAKDQLIEGIPADRARELVRVFRNTPGLTGWAAEALGVDETEAHELLERFVTAGYLEIDRRDRDGTWWFTTVRGNALASASFAKPITRATARQNLEGLIDRVRTYNADRSKPYTVTHVTVFGSYLDKTQDRLGDLDVAIEVVRRVPHDEFDRRREEIIRASERHFGSFLQRLVYPLRQLILYLRDRKSSISITGEDVAKLTDRRSVVYEVRLDEAAEQPHDGAIVEVLS